MIYSDILDKDRLTLLSNIAGSECAKGFYMAGGTALSLQMGLRLSVDFDFFTQEGFAPDNMYKELCGLTDNIRVININRNTCDVVIDDVQVSFFQYPYRMLKPYNREFVVPLAGIEDIAAMKATAIGARGAKKDFFDLFQIMNRTALTVRELVACLYEKYGPERDMSYIGMGLKYFEDAEGEPLPKLYVPFDWNKAKAFFTEMSCQFEKECAAFRSHKENT